MGSQYVRSACYLRMRWQCDRSMPSQNAMAAWGRSMLGQHVTTDCSDSMTAVYKHMKQLQYDRSMQPQIAMTV